MNPRVSTVLFQHPYKLILTFTNNEIKEFDFSSYLDYPVYSVLKDEVFRTKARVFNGTVIWDENVDFEADTHYLESKPLPQN